MIFHKIRILKNESRYIFPLFYICTWRQYFIIQNRDQLWAGIPAQWLLYSGIPIFSNLQAVFPMDTRGYSDCDFFLNCVCRKPSVAWTGGIKLMKIHWVKSPIISQEATIFQWIKPGGPSGLEYLGRTLPRETKTGSRNQGVWGIRGTIILLDRVKKIQRKHFLVWVIGKYKKLRFWGNRIPL